MVAGDDQVEERAPVVGLWIKAARRRGAEIVTVGAAGSVRCAPGTAAESVRSDLAERIKDAKSAVLIWSGGGGAGGDVVAALAGELAAAAAFYLPATPNGRAVSEAWHAAGEGEPTRPEKIGLLLVSGDEAANDPQVRALAEEADAVIAIAQFHDALRGIADLVLPATSYLERDGTMVNLEGRPQRLRRAVIPPTPDELAWIAKLAERFGVEIDPHARAVSGEEHAALPLRAEPSGPPTVPTAAKMPTAKGGPLRLLRYRPLFSGPEVERVDELQFQRPQPELELSAHDAEIRHIATGMSRRPLQRDIRRPSRSREPEAGDGAVGPPRSVRGLDQAVEVSTA